METRIAAALEAGETLGDLAGYWQEAEVEERGDIVWSLLTLEGLIYDLQRRVIAGVMPRPDVLPVLQLALGDAWEVRDGGLWRHNVERLPARDMTQRPPPTHSHSLQSSSVRRSRWYAQARRFAPSGRPSASRMGPSGDWSARIRIGVTNSKQGTGKAVRPRKQNKRTA